MEKYKQKIILFYKEYKRMPTYAEIMKLLGFKSKNSVYKLIRKLVSDGVVDKDSSGRLVPNRIGGEVPLLGLVEAGIPSPTEEQVLDTMNIDDYVGGNREASYMLRVKGDSMIEAGIHEGDMVLVERTSNAKDRDIVIAYVDQEWTIKYFRQKGGRVFLEPANKNYKPIYPEQDLQIVAVVKAVIRKY